jgi:nucleoid-associated protein YgaU
MEPGLPPHRATALRPTLLVLAGLAVLGTAAGLALRDRGALAPQASAPVRPDATAQRPSALAPIAVAPSFDVVRINPNGDAVMAGHAAPGSEVAIADGGKAIGHAQADEHGDWVFVPSAPLPPGARELTLSAQGPDQPAIPGDRSVLLVVPERPVAGNATAGNSAPPLAVLAGPNSAPVVLTGPPGRAGDRTLALGAVEYDEHGQMRLSGTAPPSETVRLYVDNRPLGQVTAGADGRWTFAPGETVAPGTHELRLDQLRRDGTVAFRVDHPFVREQLAGGAVAPGQVVIQPGQNLWLIARQTYGHGPRYTIIFQANRQQIRNPDLIYPGQVFSVPASADSPTTPAASSTSR